MLIQLIEGVYRLLWGDLLTLHLGNVTLSLSFMVILLLTAGVFFTLRTRLLPVRLFRDMLAAVCEKNDKGSGLSSFQTLVVSTATRVGMGNLVGVVAALSVGGAGAVFWMWVTALLGASTSFVESTLAQKYKQPDPLYGGGGGGAGGAISAMLEMGESRMMASTGRPAAANRAVMESDGRLLQNATSFAISQWIQYAKRAAVHTHSGSCCLSIFYFAYSTARLSRMTLTLIWPG